MDLRIRQLRPVLTLALISLMSAGSLPANAAQQNDDSYYQRGEEGWWWYAEPPVTKKEEPKEEKKKVEEPQVIRMKAPEKTPEQPAEQPEEKGPPALSAAWFRENLQHYMDKAIDNPTEENVEAYFLLQRVMMDKAQNFSDMSRKVVIGDRLLDESISRSLDPSTSRLQETLSAKRRSQTLAKVLEQAGIAYFFSEDCDLCANQGHYLELLADRVGVEVLPISIDGKPLKNGALAKETIQDKGQAEKLGVESGPAIYLMAPPDRWIPISFSVITQEEIVTRILTVAQEEGLISEQEFESTKPINHPQSLADKVPEDGDLPDDSQELIRLLRGLEQQ